ncbi:efflux RND transporter permease subunit [Microbacterium sp.]|uniref:efflux RND transporter permease subunit n=1 Tax=Microbacterium sp. TaxID=51671 RepID=UPI0039E44DEF
MSSLTRISLTNRLIVGLITIAVAVIGVFSMTALKQELMPSMRMPTAYVIVQSAGLAPEEMARTVTEPSERALSAVPGVDKVTSTTTNGSAEIIVGWPFEEGEDETLRAIRSAAESLKPSFPAGTEVQVFSGGTEDIPAMVLSAGSSEAPAVFGDALAQQVVPALQGLGGVQRVVLAGREEQRIVIAPRPADALRLGVDPAQIAPALEAHGAALPAGSAGSADGTVSVTVGTALSSLEQVAAMPLSSQKGSASGAVLVSDFADVSLETVPATTISRVNGKPAITVEVYPAQGGNVVDISHAVNAELDRLAPSLKAEFVTVFDQAPYIEQSIHDLSAEGGLGLLFAVLVILAFLGSWRSTAIAAVSIPLSLLITLIGLWWSENTLNILTLGALTIAIGRVVDDSIVVIENISRRRTRTAEGALEPLTVEAVVASVRQVAGAITASTLTTVAVFLPIAFVSGTVGQLFRPFAVTVTLALAASLVVALTIVPVLAFWFLRARDQATDAAASTPGAAEEAPHSDLDEIHTAPDRLQRTLMPVLNATRRRPVLTVVASVLVLVATIAMLPFLHTDFLGSSGNESLRVTQTPEQAGDPVAAAEPVEAAIGRVDGVRDVMTSIPLRSATGGPATISYDVQLDAGSDVEEVGDAVERALDKLSGAGDVRLETQDALAGGGGGIALQIRGTDPAALREAGDLLEKRLSDSDAVRSVKSELTGEQPVVRVRLDEVKATRLGFDRALVARTVQEALDGRIVGRLMMAGRERDIVLHTAATAPTAEELGALVLPVTAQQTAEAQKQASDRLKAEAEAAAEAERAKANADLTRQVNEAVDRRAQLSSQIGVMSGQLAQLQSLPIVPEPALSPEEEAMQRAQLERAEQLAALEEAIAGARSGIEGVDEQIAGLRQAQTDAADRLAQQQASEVAQQAATEVTGTAIVLADIATVEQELTAPTITRADGERQVTLTVLPKKGKLDAAKAVVDRAISVVELPAGVSFEVGGVAAEQDEAFGQLGAAMLGAILLVLIVMVATFRSFRGPFVLLVSIPFAATGAIIGLLVTDTALGLPALIGLLMLIGIVVTNAIVLMDLVNRLRSAGAPLEEAVEHGTRLRLRPILMTAAATIFALVPMSLGLTGGGVFISRPLAIVVIGGLISSTLLTLVLVPILYTLVERGRLRSIDRRAQRREQRAARRAERKAGRADSSPEAVTLLEELGGEAPPAR